jgi:hypothetical protein
MKPETQNAKHTNVWCYIMNMQLPFLSFTDSNPDI